MRDLSRNLGLAALLPMVVPASQARPPQITFGGGDGSSAEKAVVIKGATEATGVRAEYEYVARHFPGAKTAGQKLVNQGRRVFDVLDLKTANGKDLTLWFDITEFFGK